MKVRLTISGVILFGLLGSRCIVPPLHSQELSKTPMQVEKTFHLRVKPVKLGNDTRVTVLQDADTIEWFTNCWNNSRLKNHAECGEFINSLMMMPWFRGVQLDDGTFGFPEIGGFPIQTTLIVVTNENCVGGFLIPIDKAHGKLLETVELTCGAAPVRAPTRDPRCPPTRIDCEQIPAIMQMIAKPGRIDAPPAAPAPSAVPAVAPAPTKAGPPLEEVAKLQNQADQLNIRATTVQTSIESLRQQQHAAGFNLRMDISSSQDRMRMYLAKGNAALKGADLKSAQTYFDVAEAELGKLENFLGR